MKNREFDRRRPEPPGVWGHAASENFQILKLVLEISSVPRRQFPSRIVWELQAPDRCQNRDFSRLSGSHVGRDSVGIFNQNEGNPDEIGMVG